MSESAAVNTLTVIEGGRSVETDEEKPANVIGGKVWRMNIRRRARDLMAELEKGYMEMARIIYTVHDVPLDGDPNRGPAWLGWGYRTFRDYAETELEIRYEKALALRRIWHTLEVELADMDPEIKERVAKLGFSKVRELIKVLTIRNAQSWVELAESCNYKQIEKHVIDEGRRRGISEQVLASEQQEITADREDRLEDDGQAPSPPPVSETTTQERFHLFPSQLETVHQALKKAEKISGSDKKGHLLDLICTDFLASNDALPTDRDGRIRYLAKLEKIMGLRLVVVDPDARELVYGIDALQLVSDQ